MPFPALPAIRKALSVSGHVMFGEAPEAEASALCVDLINDILLEWSLKSIYNPGIRTVEFPSNGTNTYLLGDATGTTPASTFNPRHLNQVTVKTGNVVFPIALQSMADWELVMPKNITGVTSDAFWDYQLDQSTLNLWPIPPAGYTISITGTPTIARITNAADDIDLPEEYSEFLTWTLAMTLIPFMPPDVNVNPKVFEYIERKMNTAGTAIKRRNAHLRKRRLTIDLPSLGRNYNDGYLAWRGRAV